MPALYRLTLGLWIALWFCFVQPAAAAESIYAEKEFEGGRLEYRGEIPVLHVSGTPTEIGRQQAMLATGSIRPLLATPRNILENSGVGLGWPLIVGGAKTMFDAAPARYREELEATGAAGQLTADELGSLYVANAMVELRRVGGCSGLLVMPGKSETGEMIFGRNLDFPNIDQMGKLSLITVYHPKDQHAFAAIGFSGMVGVISGMNDAGLCLATFDSYAAKDGSAMFNPKGVPLALVNRRILEECTTVAEAKKLLESVPRTTMMSLVICDKKDAAVFELTSKTVAMREPKKDVLICTNHFITPDLSVTKECWRYDALLRYRATSSKLGLTHVGKGLNEVNQGEFTLQTMIFEPSQLKATVSFGTPPSSSRPLHTLDLSNDLRPAK